jgi:Kef-type K+ transport system membrane component KefB
MSETAQAQPLIILCGGFALALALGKAGGALAAWKKMPAVAGELAAGLLIAALAVWFPAPASLLRAPEIGLLAELGLLLLLFEVGLHATVGDLLKVSGRALAVALVGVLTPLALGVALGAIMLPSEGVGVWLFIGAALTATSVAISARVLAGRGGRALMLVLAAAVIDDILGLILLAVVLALAAGGEVSASMITITTLKAVGFLGVALLLGVTFSKKLFAFVARLKAEGLLLATALVLCFSFSLGALAAGLAAIVGAFAAGLVLEPAHSAFFTERGEKSLEDLLHPLSAVFAPVFFVHFGASLHVERLVNLETLFWGLLLTVIAILGKLVCGFVVARREADPWLVAFGMLPRGEVGLVYAAYAAGAGGQAALLPEPVVGGLVIMVLATTLLAPPLLEQRLQRVQGKG